MVKVELNNKEFKFFSNLKVSNNYSGLVSTFSFDAPFDVVGNAVFSSVKIYYDDELLLTGVITNFGAKDESKASLCSYSGYSSTGVLQDCTSDGSEAITFANYSLINIITKLIKPFGLELVMNAPNVEYEKIDIKVTDTIASVITKLCEQKNYRISHTAKGQVLIDQPNYTTVKATFNDDSKANKSQLAYSGQNTFSKYIAMKQASVESDVDAQTTVTQDIGAFRPKAQVVQDGEQGDVAAFANSMYKNSGKAYVLSLTLDKWANYANEIFKPSDVIMYSNKELGLLNDTLWVIDNVSFTDNKMETAQLKCYPAWAIFDNVK